MLLSRVRALQLIGPAAPVRGDEDAETEHQQNEEESNTEPDPRITNEEVGQPGDRDGAGLGEGLEYEWRPVCVQGRMRECYVQSSLG